MTPPQSSMHVTLLTLGDPSRLTGGHLYQRYMADRAPLHGACIEFLALPDRRFPLPALAVPRLLGDLGRSDVLLLDSIAAAYLGPAFAVHRPPLPLAAVLHQQPGGTDHGRILRTIQRPLDWLGYRHADVLLVNSEFLANHLVAAGVPRDRLRVVQPGRSATPNPADATAPRSRRGADIVILCVGNWIERKGIHELLEAFARIPTRSAKLHLVGDDQLDRSYAARIWRMLQRPDLVGRVIVHGPLHPRVVERWYHSADVFALPSRGEPFGMVYVEAMVAGLPVIGWRSGNLPYLVDGGREGLLVEPGDISGLAQALERLATDEALRRRLGAAAARRAQACPTWDESAAMLFSVLREVSRGGQTSM